MKSVIQSPRQMHVADTSMQDRSQTPAIETPDDQFTSVRVFDFFISFATQFPRHNTKLPDEQNVQHTDLNLRAPSVNRDQEKSIFKSCLH